MIKIILAVCLALALGACGGPNVRPSEPQVIRVLVPVACVKQVPEKPVLVHDNLNESYPIDQLYSAALQDKLELERYSKALDVEVRACARIEPK